MLYCELLHAQTPNCSTAKIGRYELDSPKSGKTIIIRTKLTQTEINDALNYEATYQVIWLDSCKYQLKNKRLIKGDPILAGQPSDIYIVEILKIEGSKIQIKTSSNFSNKTIERTLTKIVQ